METQQATSSSGGNTSEQVSQTVVTEKKNPSSGASVKFIVLTLAVVGVLSTSAYFVIVKTSLSSKKSNSITLVDIATTTNSINLPDVSTSTEATTTPILSEDKIYTAYSGDYTLKYPAVVEYISPRASTRDFVIETTLKKSPVYHLEPFGLQQTFSDSVVVFGVGTTTPDGGHNVFNLLEADLSVHKIASSTVYVTSPLFGYDPADWGKIKQVISIQDYIKEISTKTNIPNRKVVMETINGIQVRHIMPFILPRPYDNDTREQYQWVKDGYILSLVFTDRLTSTSTATVSAVLKQQLLNSIVSTFEVKK